MFADDFEAIAAQHTDEAFDGLTKASKSMTDEQRAAYAAKFPICIWMVAGPNEQHSFAISAN